VKEGKNLRLEGAACHTEGRGTERRHKLSLKTERGEQPLLVLPSPPISLIKSSGIQLTFPLPPRPCPNHCSLSDFLSLLCL
jgi:hypothetical protein